MTTVQPKKIATDDEDVFGWFKGKILGPKQKFPFGVVKAIISVSKTTYVIIQRIEVSTIEKPQKWGRADQF